MKNQVTVNIYGRSYQMLTGDNQEYTDLLAGNLNKRFDELKESKSNISVQDAAAFISLDLLDELVKNKQTEQNLRTQVTAYVEDAEELRTKNAKLEKEVAQLKERVRQLESQIKLRSAFAEETTAEQIIGNSISKALGAPPKK